MSIHTIFCILFTRQLQHAGFLTSSHLFCVLIKEKPRNIYKKAILCQKQTEKKAFTFINNEWILSASH